MPFKRFKILLLVITAATGLNSILIAQSKLVQNLESGQKQTLVAYGTSLTANGAWVQQLQDALQERFPDLATVVNSGGAGKYSQWGLDNLERRVLQKKPDTVFLEFSINDSVARFELSVEGAKANLETMINRLLEQNPNCEIILMTMTPGDKYPEGHRSHRKNIEAHYEMYRSVAKEHGLQLIDHYPTWKALQKSDSKLFRKYVPDTIHPNATGCTQVVTPVIFEALGLEVARHPGK